MSVAIAVVRRSGGPTRSEPLALDARGRDSVRASGFTAGQRGAGHRLGLLDEVAAELQEPPDRAASRDGSRRAGRGPGRPPSL